MVPSSFSKSKETLTGTLQSPSDDNYHLRYQNYHPLSQDHRPFFHRFRGEYKMHIYCKQNNAMAQTVPDQKAFSKQLVRGATAVPPLSPSECTQLLFTGGHQQKGFTQKNSHSSQQMNDQIHTEMASISSQDLCHQQIFAGVRPAQNLEVGTASTLIRTAQDKWIKLLQDSDFS